MYPEIELLLEQGDRALAQNEHSLADTLYNLALHESDLFKDEVGFYMALEKRADLCLLLNKHEEAARLYLGAYFEAANKHDNEHATLLYAKYKKTKIQFFEQNKRDKRSARQQLQEMRQDVSDILAAHDISIDRIEWTKVLLNLISNTIRSIIEREFYKGVTKLGNPPTKFCVIALGSFGRQEMSTHSDVEYAVIIDDASPANVKYFIQLSQLLNIQLIRLGETDINDRHSYGLRDALVNNRHPVPKGVSMDQGYKTPPGKPDEYRLVDSCDKLAELSDDTNFAKRSHLIAAMLSSSFMLGDNIMFDQYKNACRDRLSRISPEVPGMRIHQVLANKFFQADLQYFNMEKTYVHFFHDQGKINCKDDIYRPFNRFIESLSLLCFGVEDRDLDSFSRIDKLESHGIISDETGNVLKKDFAIIEQLRMRLYLFHQEQREGLCLTPSDYDFPITEELKEDIGQVLTDLKLIFDKIKQYVASQETKCFYHLFKKCVPDVAAAPLSSEKQTATFAEKQQFFPNPIKQMLREAAIKRSNSCPDLRRAPRSEA